MAHRRHNRCMSPVAADAFRIVFVCTGNICRSPMADIVFRKLVTAADLSDRVVSTSAATGDWHVGERADVRTLEALTRRGYDGSAHRARQFTAETFRTNDLVIALDRSHERSLQHWAADESQVERVSLLRSFDPGAGTQLDVPDPYYADQAMFDDVLTMIERSVHGLFDQLQPAFRAPRR